MKQKLSLTLGIIVLLIIGLATSPAKAVNPTLKSISDAIAALQNSVNNMPPAWYQILPSDQRFLLVMGDEAVLDRETGLVWAKSPGITNYNWRNAQRRCNTLIVQNRMGWRLPTFQELASLFDPSDPSAHIPPYLPAGHPFAIDPDQSMVFWSATTLSPNPDYSDYAWIVNFKMGNYGFAPKSDEFFNWCVRGGQGVDPQ